MDYALSPDQEILVDAVDGILAPYREQDLGAVRFRYADDLAEELEKGGYLGIASEEGCGSLEAALLVESIARLPQVVEVAATALVAPHLGVDPSGPIALTSLSEAGRPIRFLPVAERVIFDDGDRAYEVPVDRSEVEAVDSVYAYPVGRLRHKLDRAGARDLGAGSGPVYRQWRRLGLALEACGAACGALDFTVAYVKERRQFGRPIGSFQAVQHRLAECVELISGARWLALVAAWTGSPSDAAIAATHVQGQIGKLAWDLHCFNGAQSWTLSYPLHFWTFRLRALQGEMGGSEMQAIAASQHTWLRRAAREEAAT